jgi:hypothetical protein
MVRFLFTTIFTHLCFICAGQNSKITLNASFNKDSVAMGDSKFSSFGQNTDEQKFFLSVGGGFDFPTRGVSNTEPRTGHIHKGFQLHFDGAWFLTPNYGIGLKYSYRKRVEKAEGFSALAVSYNVTYPIYEYRKDNFDEITHFIGPAAFGRWNLGTAGLSVHTSLSV